MSWNNFQLEFEAGLSLSNSDSQPFLSQDTSRDEIVRMTFPMAFTPDEEVIWQVDSCYLIEYANTFAFTVKF